jgi:nucleoside-diphosphate-sugar epimerase
MLSKKILITGASGFIGKALCCHLSKQGCDVLGTVRSVEKQTAMTKDGISTVVVEDISSDTDWTDILSGVDVVIHTAARVHVLNDDAEDKMEKYRNANTHATSNLVRQSASANVSHFIFLSSIKVNGEATTLDAFTEKVQKAPTDEYGLSKYEAELEIEKICQNFVMSYTVFRLPLVYGMGVKANFANLVRLVKKNLPLPFGMIKNKRSLLYIGNLISVIAETLNSSFTHNQIFLLSDGEDISTKDLVKKIAYAYAVNCILVPVPPVLFKIAGKLTGKDDLVSRLLGSLQLDSSKVRKVLHWSPPYTVDTALAEMAEQEKQDRKLK